MEPAFLAEVRSAQGEAFDDDPVLKELRGGWRSWKRVVVQRSLGTADCLSIEEEARRLWQPEEENRKLKQLVADLSKGK